MTPCTHVAVAVPKKIFEVTGAPAVEERVHGAHERGHVRRPGSVQARGTLQQHDRWKTTQTEEMLQMPIRDQMQQRCAGF